MNKERIKKIILELIKEYREYIKQGEIHHAKQIRKEIEAWTVSLFELRNSTVIESDNKRPNNY